MKLTEDQRELICEYLDITLSFMKFPGSDEYFFNLLAENIPDNDDIFEGSDIIKIITDKVYEDSYDWDLDSELEEKTYENEKQPLKNTHSSKPNTEYDILII